MWLLTISTGRRRGLEGLDAAGADADADADRVPGTLPTAHRTPRLGAPGQEAADSSVLHRRASGWRSSARDSLSSTPLMSSRPSSIAPNDSLAAQLVGEMCALHDALAKSTAAAGSLAPQSHDPTLLHSQLEQLRALEQELDTKRALAHSLDLEYKKLASDQLVSRKALEEVKNANHNLKQAVKALSSAIHQANAALTLTLEAAAEFSELQQTTASTMDTIAAELPNIAQFNGGPAAAGGLAKVGALRDDLQSQADALQTMRKLSRTLETQLSTNAALSADERAAPSRAVEELEVRAAAIGGGSSRRHSGHSGELLERPVHCGQRTRRREQCSGGDGAALVPTGEDFVANGGAPRSGQLSAADFEQTGHNASGGDRSIGDAAGT